MNRFCFVSTCVIVFRCCFHILASATGYQCVFKLYDVPFFYVSVTSEIVFRRLSRRKTLWSVLCVNQWIVSKQKIIVILRNKFFCKAMKIPIFFSQMWTFTLTIKMLQRFSILNGMNCSLKIILDKWVLLSICDKI